MKRFLFCLLILTISYFSDGYLLASSSLDDTQDNASGLSRKRVTFAQDNSTKSYANDLEVETLGQPNKKPRVNSKEEKYKNFLRTYLSDYNDFADMMHHNKMGILIDEDLSTFYEAFKAQEDLNLEEHTEKVFNRLIHIHELNKNSYHGYSYNSQKLVLLSLELTDHTASRNLESHLVLFNQVVDLYGALNDLFTPKNDCRKTLFNDAFSFISSLTKLNVSSKNCSATLTNYYYFFYRVIEPLIHYIPENFEPSPNLYDPLKNSFFEKLHLFLNEAPLTTKSGHTHFNRIFLKMNEALFCNLSIYHRLPPGEDLTALIHDYFDFVFNYARTEDSKKFDKRQQGLLKKRVDSEKSRVMEKMIIDFVEDHFFKEEAYLL